MVSTDAKLAKLTHFITLYDRITIKQLAKFSRHLIGDSIYNLMKHLGLSKVSARWIPHILTKTKTIAGSNVLKLIKNYKYCNRQRLSGIVTSD